MLQSFLITNEDEEPSSGLWKLNYLDDHSRYHRCIDCRIGYYCYSLLRKDKKWKLDHNQPNQGTTIRNMRLASSINMRRSSTNVSALLEEEEGFHILCFPLIEHELMARSSSFQSEVEQDVSGFEG